VRCGIEIDDAQDSSMTFKLRLNPGPNPLPDRVVVTTPTSSIGEPVSTGE
jgi:hypothetical protein